MQSFSMNAVIFCGSWWLAAHVVWKTSGRGMSIKEEREGMERKRRTQEEESGWECGEER
jgi:hypothetical protein